jgi:hypothetical protein
MVIACSEQNVDRGEADRKGRVAVLSNETAYIDGAEYLYITLLIT